MPRNVILIQGNAREDTGVASGVIRPGMLVEPTGTGKQFKAHDTAGDPAAAVFAREQHENDGAGIDTNIASGDEFAPIFPEMGAKVNAVTDDTIARGEWVESAGDGTVRLWGSGYRIGYAAAASDLSGTVGRVEIIIAPVGV